MCVHVYVCIYVYLLTCRVWGWADIVFVLVAWMSSSPVVV